MALISDDFDSHLAAASGADPVLAAELRAGFVESLAFQVDLLRRARCDGNWQVTASRLRGLGATFHAGGVVALAEEALAGAPGDPSVIRKFDAVLGKFGA